MTESHILEMEMPAGAFCAFLGFWHLVRYFTLFLGHAEKLYQSLKISCVYGENNLKFTVLCRLFVPERIISLNYS